MFTWDLRLLLLEEDLDFRDRGVLGVGIRPPGETNHEELDLADLSSDLGDREWLLL